ncbi:hypothetical protein BGX28_006285 [Mortierella sp. GBA30]|nr:hypothetical protein BGX28_006285 [Mortierella sp. GBA30]
MGQTNSTPSSSSRNGRRSASSSTSSSGPSTAPSSSQPSTRTHAQPHSDSSTGTMQQQQQPPQQPPPSSSRVLRSTTERRRRANLFSSFYPLLSRGSSSSNNNIGGNSSPDRTDVQEGSSSDASPARGRTLNAPTLAATANATGSSSSIADNNCNAYGVPRPDWPSITPSISATGSSSGMVTRSASRSPALQPPSTSSNGRTPRGLSRVQRMYDEQSIRSTRSSSRASSVVAVTPPVNNPATIQHPPAEYMDMDIDPESVGLAPQQEQQEQTATTNTQTSDAIEPSQPAALPLSISLPSDHAAHSASTADLTPSRAAHTRSRMRASQEPASSASSTAAGSDSFSLLAGLSNPRGGTSISSSLLPIRPDSDDDDDMDVDHDQPASSAASASDTPIQHTRPQRARRYPGPDLIADLIHHQFVQSLRESIGVTDERPPQQHQDTQSNTESSSSGTVTASTEGAQNDSPLSGSPSGLRHRRLRSASMQSLSGAQPANETASTDASATLDPSSSATAETGANTPGSNMDRSQFLMNQLPLFMRLLTDLSRGFRPPGETDEETADRRGRHLEERLAATNDPLTGTTTTTAEDSANTATDTGSESSSEPSFDRTETGTDNNAQPRRRNATIRFVQIGGGPGHVHRPRTGATGSANENDENDENSSAGESENRGEDFGEAIILFLSGPHTDSHSDTEATDASVQEGSSDSETGRDRARQRSPWIVLSLSGGYISSLLAANADREGGANYDDLWMLSNLIGPARPITTTQEAIDRAGFPVGRFEQAVHGIRDVITLGDGTKCLVCMSEYEEGEDMRALKCRHGFHQECIDKWLTTGANKCPVCRAAAVESEPPATEPEVSVGPQTNEE